MSKLLRCYVANYGLNDSWYDGVLLDFRNNDKAVHSIINLDNGGGKTTLLSFLFSVIDPRKDYFLKSRQNANHKVSDYFSKSGVPGTCILEWSAPSTSNPRRVYVTGRSVHLKPNQDVEDVMFCYFKESANAIEDFPGPNLGDNEPAMHWDGIQAWLAVRKKEQGFFQNGVQTSWFDRLRADGIVDSSMIRTQMKFSETEGGVDSFVAFKTQEEFLKKFIELASPDEILDKVHQNVVEFKTKAKNLPELEKCNNELLDAISILGKLQTQHNAWTNQETHVARAVQSLVGLHEQIHGYFGHVDASFAQASSQIEHWKKTLSTAKTSLATAEAQERYAAAVRAFATCRSNDVQLKALAQTIATDEDRIKHMDFVLLSKKIAEHVAIRQTLENEIASILHVQAPLRNRLALAATAFHHGLTNARVIQDKSLAEENDYQVAALYKIKSHKARVLELTTRIAKQTVKQTDASHRLNAILACQKEMELTFNTPIDDLGAYLQATIHELVHAQEILSESLQGVQAKKYEITNAVRDEDRTIAGLQSSLQQANAWLEDQRRTAATYEAEPLLRAIVDGSPNLNMPTLVGHIDEEIASHSATTNLGLVQTTKLQERIERLENHQNEHHDANIDTVLAWLHTHGFHQAVSSVQYIASLSPAQRAVYLTNYPQGANGIFVHPEHLADLHKKMASVALPDTFQHVWVTTFTGLEVHPTNGFYFPLTNDANYDSEKARATLNGLRSSLHDLRTQQHLHEQRGKLLQRLRFNIESYQKSYPVQEQEEVMVRIAQLTNDHEVATQKHAHLSATLAATMQAIVQHQEDLLDAKRQAQAKVPAMEQALRWLSEEYAHLASINQELLTARDDAAQAGLDMASTEQQQQHAEVGLDQSKDRARALERLRQDTLVEQNALEMVDPQSPALALPGHATLDYLRAEYLRYLGEWRLKSEEQISATQQVHLASCKNEIAKLEKEQHKFVVPNAMDLGISPDDVSEVSKEKEIAALAEKKRNYQSLDVRVMVARRDYLVHKDVKISEDDAMLDAPTAARNHEQTKYALQQGQDAVKTAQDQLVATQDASSALRETVYLVKGLKDVFDVSVKDIDCPPCTVILAELDVPLWTSQRDAALSEYRSQSTELLSLGKARETSYNQYANYRSLHSDNVYLRAQNHQDPNLLLDDAVLTNLLLELGNISASMSSDIDAHQSDQSRVVTELVTHASALTVLIEDALSQKVPQGAPLIGGMNVLRVKSSKTPFSAIGHAERLSRVTALLDDYLTGAKAFPTTSRDLFGHAIAAIYAKTLDFQILKMVENEKERYSFVHQVKNSGAEGVTMAMCLYMTILSVRSKPEKGQSTRDAGVLLIDNPFAKATSNKFWAALHNLADHYRVQFVFLTAVSDPETLRDFQHYIALTKKLDTVTGRRILTTASITFTTKEVPDAIVDMV